MLWELFQMSRIEQGNWKAGDARLAAREAQGDVRQIQHKVQVLERQCERLGLAAMAMAEFLRDRLGVKEQEIEAKIIEIDQRDGSLDGRFRPPAEPCPQCHRQNGPHRRHCLYCGTELAADSFLFQPGE